MKTLLISIAVIIISLFLGCTEETVLMPDTDLVVVQAYLYANEPVNDIRLTSTIPLDADTSEAPPLTDAEIVLIKEGQSYDLEPDPDRKGYYVYSGDDLKVETDDQFTIEIHYHDQFITGNTQVPEPPEKLKIAEEILYIPDFYNFDKFDRSLLDSAAVEVTWENNDGFLFFIVLDNIEENPVEIESGFPSLPNRFISQPIKRDSFRINFRLVTHYGRHRIKLYRINQEYADLYETREQDSRDLNEPLTNIENGLGIFSAFNSDSLYFTALQE